MSEAPMSETPTSSGPIPEAPADPDRGEPSEAQPSDADAIRSLLAVAAAADGVAPMSETFRMRLGDPGSYLVRAPGGEPAAYGAVVGSTGELVVHPDRRRAGVGSAVLDRLRHAGATEVWAHGDLPASRGFAGAHGLRSIRLLHLLGRGLTDADAAAPTFPAGFELASFRPGDEDAWLAVNAAAFASHPEQGQVDAAALAALMAQDWFDPSGLLMLWAPDGRLAASHWTKVDPEQVVVTADGPLPAGEVYVLAVSPAFQGRGLAGPMTAAGLAHLTARGLRHVVLYVDDDNSAAMATYRRQGFTPLATDRQYAVPHAVTRDPGGSPAAAGPDLTR